MTEMELTVKIDVNDKYIIAPKIIDLYPYGFIQTGKAKEGFKKWEPKNPNRDCSFYNEGYEDGKKAAERRAWLGIC